MAEVYSVQLKPLCLRRFFQYLETYYIFFTILTHFKSL